MSLHVAAVKTPFKHVEVPDTVNPESHVGWQLEPEASTVSSVGQLPTAPLLGATDAVQPSGVVVVTVVVEVNVVMVVLVTVVMVVLVTVVVVVVATQGVFVPPPSYPAAQVHQNEPTATVKLLMESVHSPPEEHGAAAAHSLASSEEHGRAAAHSLTSLHAALKPPPSYPLAHAHQ